MKRMVVYSLLICFLCVWLSSCRSGYKAGETFSPDFLQSVSLEGMPLPTVGQYALNDRTAGRQTLKMETDVAGLETYINAFIAYMNAREDIYYFGMQESEGLLGEMVPHRVAREITGDFTWESSIYWYTFTYSLTAETDDHTNCSTHGAYKDPIIVKFEYDSEDKVAYVTVTKNDVFASDCIDEVLLVSDAWSETHAETTANTEGEGSTSS